MLNTGMRGRGVSWKTPQAQFSPLVTSTADSWVPRGFALWDPPFSFAGLHVKQTCPRRVGSRWAAHVKKIQF